MNRGARSSKSRRRTAAEGMAGGGAVRARGDDLGEGVFT